MKVKGIYETPLLTLQFTKVTFMTHIVQEMDYLSKFYNFKYLKGQQIKIL